MAKRVEGRVLVENARIIFRNFQGVKTEYNPPGKRNFSVILEESAAQAMLEDGWNVKRLRPREDDENQAGTPHLKVNVSWDNVPPQIVLITEKTRKRQELTEETVALLDVIDIVNVDLVINPFNWGPNPRGESGVSAYAKKMFVTMAEDYLDMKYADAKEMSEDERAEMDF